MKAALALAVLLAARIAAAEETPAEEPPAAEPPSPAEQRAAAALQSIAEAGDVFEVAWHKGEVCEAKHPADPLWRCDFAELLAFRLCEWERQQPGKAETVCALGDETPSTPASILPVTGSKFRVLLLTEQNDGGTGESAFVVDPELHIGAVLRLLKSTIGDGGYVTSKSYTFDGKAFHVSEQDQSCEIRTSTATVCGHEKRTYDLSVNKKTGAVTPGRRATTTSLSVQGVFADENGRERIEIGPCGEPSRCDRGSDMRIEYRRDRTSPVEPLVPLAVDPKKLEVTVRVPGSKDRMTLSFAETRDHGVVLTRRLGNNQVLPPLVSVAP